MVSPSRNRSDQAAEFLKALANPNRLMILARLLRADASVGELETELGIRQPTLSQQLAGLRDAGLVEARRDAKQVFYRLLPKRSTDVAGVLNLLFGGATIVAPAGLDIGVSSRPARLTAAAQFARIIDEPIEAEWP